MASAGSVRSRGEKENGSTPCDGISGLVLCREISRATAGLVTTASRKFIGHSLRGRRIGDSQRKGIRDRASPGVDMGRTGSCGRWLSATVFGVFFVGELAFAQDLPTLSIADATADETYDSVEEADATIDFVVSLSESASGEVTVDYATSDGTAVAVEDYAAASGTLTFAAGTIEQTVSVALVDDSLDELSETFELTISSPTGATIDDGVATGSIGDDDPEPELNSLSGSILAPEGRHSGVDVTVYLSARSGRTVTVDYATVYRVTGGSSPAEAGTDYTHVAGTLTFDPGETRKTVTVGLLAADEVYEGNEQFGLRFSNADGATVYVSPGHIFFGDPFLDVIITLRDSLPMPDVTIGDAIDVESAGELAFPVTLTGPIQGSMKYSTVDGTAVAGQDYTAATDATLSFGPGETSKTIRIAIVDDDVAERGTETFSVSLSQTIPNLIRSVGELEATGTVRDDDGSARLYISDESASEGDSMSFAITLAQSSGTVTVDYATEDVTATEGRDYAEASGTLTFAAGEVRKTVTVTSLDDDVHEGSETFSVSLSGAEGAMVEDGTGTGTILDNEESPSVTILGSQGAENGHLDFTVTLSTSSEATVILDYVTDTEIEAFEPPAFELAEAGSDFVYNEGTIIFAPGATSKTIRVTLLADTVPEASEAVVVTLTDPVNVRFELRDGSDECPWSGCFDTACCDCGIILDGTQDSTLAVADAEISEDGGKLSFAATLNPASASDVTVSYSTSDGTAVAGDDYEAASGTLTLSAGETEGTIEVVVLDDSVVEPDEDLTVTLSDPMNAVLGDAAATGTILDDDEASTAITLTVDPPRATEDGGPVEIGVTASLDAAARSEATTVTVSVAGSGVNDAVDFDPVAGFAITIGSGETSGAGMFTLTPENDAVDELDETLSVDGTSDLPVTGTTVALVDDDEASTAITLTADPPRATEDGGPAEVTVTATLDAGSGSEATTVTVSVAGSGVDAAVDFDPVADFAITIGSGETSGAGMFTLTPEDDGVDELDETLSVDGTSDLPVTGTTITLVDDDEASVAITLTADPPRATEDGGPAEVTVTATLDAGARSEATTVTVSVAGSGVDAAVDFDEVGDFAILIAAGERSGAGAFTLNPEDDNLDESDETVTISGNSDLSVTGATIELADDDEPSSEVLLSASPGRIPEDGGAMDVDVTATLDASARAVSTTISVSVTDSGQSDAVGYTASAMFFDIMIGAGQTTGTRKFTVTPENDGVDEQDELLDITGTSDLPVSPTSVTLTDDEQESTGILLSAVPSTVSEGAGETSVEVTATLDAGARTEPTTVTLSVTGSGDPDAVDFTAVQDFTIVIAAETTSGKATFTLTPEDDEVAESVETLTMAGSADLSVTETSVTITDDDVASDGILLSASPEVVSEGGGAASVRVTASLNGAGRQTATTVTVSVSGSGDSQAVDFQSVQDFEITIAANATSGTGAFTLVPMDDGATESDETLTVSGVSDLEVTPTTVRLADDDEASSRILLSVTPGRVSEGEGSTAIMVTAALDRASRQQATTVEVSVSGSGHAGSVDFESVQDFEITIPANVLSGTGTFTLTPEDDGTVESDETVTVSGQSDLPVTSSAVLLTDDDEASTRILLSAAPGRVAEDQGPTTVVVTATLDKSPRAQSTTVAVSVAGSGDPNAVDFEPVTDFAITIPANSASATGTFILAPENDRSAESNETLSVDGTSDLPVTASSVVLVDDDEGSTRIFLSVVPSRISEGAGPTTVAVTASLDRGLRQTATAVTVSVSGSGDPEAVDFDPVADFLITIGANRERGTGTFTLTPQDDRDVETDEILTLSGVSDLPVTSATVTLADDDEISTRILLFLSVNPSQASEGGGPVEVKVTAALDRGVRPDPTRIAVSVSGSGDPLAVDFASVPDFQIVIPANASNGTAKFTVVPEDDAIVERDEVLTVSGASDLPVTPATLSLLDDDKVGAILLSAVPAVVREDGGPVAVTVTASLDRSLRQGATAVTVSISGTGDPGAVDFAPVADFGITIGANAESAAGTFTLVPVDDAEDEVDETLTVSGVSDLPVTPATIKLRDDDEMTSRTLLIADAEASEGAGEVRFAVTLDGPSGAEVTVGYETADPAGSSDPVAEAGIDYESASGTLTFAPGEVSQTIRVPVIDDDLDEPDESFALVLSDPRGATLGRGSALGTILDDDEPPTVSIAGTSGAEDVGELAFAVALSARSLTGVTVDYASMDGTAVAGNDYDAVEGTLTFAAGEVWKTIRVPVIDDALDEADEETFAVALSAPTGATLDAGTATGTIRDDDEPPALSVADAAGDEDVGELEFAVTLSAPSGIEVSASYATKDGTATAGGDYAAATGTLVFAPGEVSRTIRVAILDDALHEADEETFELTLARLANATPADVSATGTIRDDDLAPPSLAGDLPAALLCVGGAPHELDLADYFAGEELRFSAVSSTPLVATAALDGSMLTVAPASEGESTVTVTAANDAGSVESPIGVRVVTDPAELEAVESVLASIGRVVLTGVTDSVRARFGPTSAGGEQEPRPMSGAAGRKWFRGASGVLGNQWPDAPMRDTRSVGWDGNGILPESQVSGDDWFETMNRTYRRGPAPFSFALDSGQSGSTGPAWGVWGRADAHRFESGIDGSSHDGTLTAVHLGADARFGDWLAGVSVARSDAEADYRFERSADACGGGGVGEGMVEAGLTSVHPYVGRRVGRGQVWATVGVGGGEVSLERCETGHRNETDLSMRLGALGGRHPFAGGERIEISVVEEIGVLDLTTGDALGLVGDRSVTVGQARLGLEASGVVPAGCECSLSSFVRAFARGDWGDGATGTGLELAAGVRFRNVPRRLGIDAGIRALAAHSAEDASERSANLTFSLLPKADGTGWQASLAWRQGAGDSRLDALGGISPWTAPSASLPGAERRWIAESRLGYGIRLQRGFATPFVELDAGQRDGARFGVRHEFGDRARGLVIEWGIEPSSFGSAGNRILLEALGRF